MSQGALRPSARRLLRSAALALVVAAAASGCTRALSVGSDAGPIYRLTVHNEATEAMIVSYNDGRGDALLGTVPARSTDHFSVGRPATTSVTVHARNVAGTRSAGPFSVLLSTAAAQVVTIR
jgi:hypothetical protein